MVIFRILNGLMTTMGFARNLKDKKTVQHGQSFFVDSVFLQRFLPHAGYHSKRNSMSVAYPHLKPTPGHSHQIGFLVSHIKNVCYIGK
jgi:hypothetical protein